MLSVIIPTLNAEATLPATLNALIPATIEGIVKEVIIVDGGSEDQTKAIGDAAGAVMLDAERGRGMQLAAGAEVARHPWLLFLHADTALARDWEFEASAFIEKVDTGALHSTAAAFRFGLDDEGVGASVVAAGVALRCRLFRLPYGDQGLLMPASLYREIGGFRPMPLLEDVDIVRRLGRRRIHLLRSQAMTSARRYRADGYTKRVLRNWACLAMYAVGVPLPRIVNFYNRGSGR